MSYILYKNTWSKSCTENEEQDRVKLKRGRKSLKSVRIVVGFN